MSKHNILITGGTGYLGSYLVEKLLTDNSVADKLIIYSRDELKHFNLKLRIGNDPRVKFVIGDVRDQDRLAESMNEVDIVIHTAAMKHVDICEENPSECVKTNINGTENVIKAAQASDVKKLIFISTDKAVEPVSIYGDSKQMSERLVLNANAEKLESTVLRLGNLIGSPGSIVDKLGKISRSQTFKVHDENMTRFHDTLENAGLLIENAIQKDFGGCILIPKLKSVSVLDIAHCLSENVVIEKGAYRNFEKVHEKLVADNESYKLLENEQCLILPKEQLTENEGLERYRSLPASMKEYSSDKVKLLNPNEIASFFRQSPLEEA